MFQKMLDLFHEEKTYSLAEIAEQLQESEENVRARLVYLVHRGLIKEVTQCESDSCKSCSKTCSSYQSIMRPVAYQLVQPAHISEAHNKDESRNK